MLLTLADVAVGFGGADLSDMVAEAALFDMADVVLAADVAQAGMAAEVALADMSALADMVVQVDEAVQAEVVDRVVK